MEQSDNQESKSQTTELIECLRECSEDLACELDARYPSRQDYPIEMQRWQRDMAPVFRARKLLEKHDAR